MTDNELEKLCVQISELYTQHNVGGFAVVISSENTKAMVAVPNWTVIALGENDSVVFDDKKQHPDVIENKVQNTMYFLYMAQDFFNYIGDMFMDVIPEFKQRYKKELKKLVNSNPTHLH